MRARLNRLFFWLTAIFYFWSYYFQNPIHLSYTLEFGVTGAALGLVSSLGLCVSVFSMPLVAQAARRYGSRTVLALGYMLQFMSFFTTWSARSIAFIALGNLFNGLSFAITIVLMASIAVSIYPPERAGTIVSLYTMLQALGQATATSAGLWASRMYGYRGNFLVSAVLSVFCLLFCLSMTSHGRAGVENAAAPPPERTKFPRSVYPILLLCVFCGITVCALQSYTEPFVRYTGHTRGVELFFSIYAGVMVLVRLLLANSISRLRLRPSVLCLSPVLAGAMLLMQWQSSPIALWLGAAFAALGLGLLQTLAQYQVFESFSPQEKSRASSVYYMGFYGGMIAGNFCGSFLFTGPLKPYFFACCAVLALFPAVGALLPRKMRGSISIGRNTD